MLYKSLNECKLFWMSARLHWMYIRKPMIFTEFFGVASCHQYMHLKAYWLLITLSYFLFLNLRALPCQSVESNVSFPCPASSWISYTYQSSAKACLLFIWKCVNINVFIFVWIYVCFNVKMWKCEFSIS